MPLRSWILVVVACCVALLAGAEARADLAAYVKKDEADYAWKLQKTREVKQGTIYEIALTSQKWQGIVWKHDLVVYVPKDVKPKATMLLYNTGGKPGERDTVFGFALANNTKSPVAFLFGIPNQPLFPSKENNNKGLTEDALIAETFVKYLQTKDASWPLLFPMVKSVVKAMDALQAFAKQEWKAEVKNFVLTGGSKRGWTTWLTAAVEPRIKAIAPMVIDTLNMAKQLPHQKESYGDYSLMIKDYTQRDLVPLPDSADARKLWGMVDPWVYRKKFTMSKMIINGTNDPYWSQDALNLYWDDLPSEKWVSYIPNAGHGLSQTRFGVPNFDWVLNVLSAFALSQIDDKPMPKMTWKHGEGKNELTVKSDIAMKAVRLWTADADTRDFRKAKWTSSPLKGDKEATAKVEAPKEGCRVYLVECEYEMDKLKYSLCTQVTILGTPKKAEKK